MRFGKALKITLVTVLVVVVGAIAAVVGLLMYGGPPMQSGSTLVDGKITLVVDRMGPVRIGVYFINLEDGGFALVDTGKDPEAKAILSAMNDRGAHASDVRAILLTHSHDDHSGGVRAFPNARVFALEPDAIVLRQGGLATQGLADGERIVIAGTAIETFAVPGHTAGSAAYLIHGVLFLGDAAAPVSESAVAPNDFAFTVNVELNHRSLHALVDRLKTRASEIRYLAFGHQGPMKGFGPLMDWASRDNSGESR